MKRKGFTLIELLVVIAIIGLLSTLSVVSLNSARGKARDAAKKSDMNAIATAMELYNVEIGYYPLSAGVCNSNIIALNAAGDNIICSTHSISTDSDTILQSIPSSPDDTDYIGFTGATPAAATSFCISAELEDGSHFKCVNGSCFEDDDECETN
jgi:type II secretion system protein G